MTIAHDVEGLLVSHVVEVVGLVVIGDGDLLARSVGVVESILVLEHLVGVAHVVDHEELTLPLLVSVVVDVLLRALAESVGVLEEISVAHVVSVVSFSHLVEAQHVGFPVVLVEEDLAISVDLQVDSVAVAVIGVSSALHGDAVEVVVVVSPVSTLLVDEELVVETLVVLVEELSNSLLSVLDSLVHSLVLVGVDVPLVSVRSTVQMSVEKDLFTIQVVIVRSVLYIELDIEDSISLLVLNL